VTNFSDFIVYADESGSASLEGTPDPAFPMFVLSMMLVSKASYTSSIVDPLQELKFRYVGHDQLILHEREIRRQSGAFAFLQVDKSVRDAFLADLDKIVEDAKVAIYAAVIDKPKLKAKYASPYHPYDLALGFLMERILDRLLKAGEAGKLVHVVFECRGKTEDAELELSFRRIAANQFNWGYKAPDFTKMRWEPLFIDKKANSGGLQLADLVARPIGLKRIRPTQANHAYDIIQKKIPHDGLKWFP
jgi:hypothetical protein